jgi:hypothetical protein
MNSEIIQNVAYDNYDDFQHNDFIVSQNFISLFWGLFNDETDLRVRYCASKKETLAHFWVHHNKISTPSLYCRGGIGPGQKW